MDQQANVPIQLRAAREAFSSWDGLLAFGFGSGLLPRAPGTWGTLVAIPFLFPLKALPAPLMWMALAGLFLLGAWICGRVGARLGVEDYGGIVWDEMLGFWLTMALVPASLPWLLVGFALFRFFDIVKPWPISQVELRFQGGLGVMLDDVLAAAFAMVLLAGAHRVLGG